MHMLATRLLTAVVAITAHPTPESEAAILSAGAVAQIAKPLDADRMGRLVGSLLSLSASAR